MLRTTLLTTAVLSSLLAAGPALALPQDAAMQARSSMNLSARNADGSAFEVRVENGEVVSLRINGEDAPIDRARVTDQGVEVLGEDGEVIHRFAVRMAGAPAPAAPKGRVQPAVPGGPQIQVFDERDAPRAPKPPKAPATPKQAATAGAKSMIGAGFGEVDEAVAHHLKVDRTKTTMITSVLDAMPAKKAGLERFDVVVGIDGKEGAAINDLRSAIAKAEPGTKMKLSVRRGAETKELEVETAAFDATKLSVATGFPQRQDDGAQFRVDGGGEDGDTTMFFIGPDGQRREIRVPGLRGLPQPRFDRIDPMEIEGMNDAIREMVEQMLEDAGIEGAGAMGDEAPADARPAPRKGGDAAEDRLRRMEERMEDLRRELERERAARGGKRPADA
jgi:hypothetical protein